MPINAPPLGSWGNPVDWIDMGAQHDALMRGRPKPFAFWQRRPRGPQTIPQGAPFYIESRAYDRGAAAYAPVFGLLFTNPIGAGVPSSYRLPTITGPGARYEFGAIWFNPQTIPTSIHMAPTMPAQSIDALLAQSHVAGMYVTEG